jgi:hypothetical protein
LPGPCSYEVKDNLGKSKIDGIVHVADRKTIFDEMQHETKKKNYPAAGLYDRVSPDVDKTKLKSDLRKAEKASYIDCSMRDSLDAPGVG